MTTQENMIWLTTSLFSSKRNWSRIIAEGIAPFLTNSKLLKGYFLELNYSQGENIRLALLANNADAETLLKQLDKHFKYYFANAELFAPKTKFPIDKIFMPLPNNTIQYGLYQTNVTYVNELDEYAILTALSKTMMDTLTDEIDDEVIITLACYLQIGLIKAIYSYTNRIDLLLSITDCSNKDDKINKGRVINMGLMDKIMKDVMQKNELNIESDWLGDWVEKCEAYLNTINNRQGNVLKLVKEYHDFTTTLVFKCLGINKDGQVLLRNCINSSLRGYLK